MRVRSWGNERQGWTGALLAGAALRTWFCWHHPRFTGDTLVYGDLAHNLLTHRIYGLTEDHVRSTLIRLPGYPLFLAGCFALFGAGRYVPVILVQAGMDLLSCVLLGLVAKRVWGRRAGLWVVWLAALCPFTANYTAAALTETPSLFAVSMGMWGLLRWTAALRAGQDVYGWASVVGAASVTATLLRPDGVLLAGALVLPMLWEGWRCRAMGPRLRSNLRDGPDTGATSQSYAARARRSLLRQSLVSAAVAVGMLGLALGVWAGRNWAQFHVFQPLAPKYANDPGETAPLGFARWYRTWAIGFNSTVEVYWLYDGDPLRLSDLPARAFDSAAQQRETAALYASYNDALSATPEVEAGFGALAAERVRSHPVRYYVGLPVAKLADMWLRPRTELMKMPLEWWRWRAHPWRSGFQAGYAGLNLALLGLAAVGWRLWQRRGWGVYTALALTMAGLVLLRSALLLTIDNSEPRYTLECYPVVLLLAGFALSCMMRGAVEL